MIRFYTLLIISFVLHFPLMAQEIAYHPNKYWHVAGNNPQESAKYSFHYFFPQYGFSARLVDGKWITTEWEVWKKQNNFSYAYPLTGHSWQNIIENHEDVFQQHPEYLAEINGKRLGYGKTTKFCVSNKSLQTLFVQDRIVQFEKQNDPNGSISVEPSDGGGFCECKDCKKFGSISNQVFFLANITAVAIHNRYPKGKVNLLAYYTHAEVPDFDVEPNIHVTVVPDGFQSIYDGDVLLNVWAKKVKLRTYYEYFAIPQWTGSLPRLYMQNYLRRMQLAKQLGYQGFWFEAGSSINTIIALRLFNQLWVNTNLTWEAISEQFLHTCFKDSYQPIKELFTRWWYTWLPNDEIPMAINNLQDATSLAKSKDERERINDLKAYLHYIILFQEWNKDKTNHNATLDLFNFVFNSANRLIVHPAAFYSIYNNYLDKQTAVTYNPYIKNDWSWINPLTSETIEKDFKTDFEKYGTKQNNFFFTDLKNAIPETLKKKIPNETFQFSSQLSEKIFFYGKGRVVIELIKPIDIAAQNDMGLYLSILTSSGSLITRRFIPYKNPKITIHLSKEDTYSLSLLQFFQTGVKINGSVIPILTMEQKKRLQDDKKLIINKTNTSKKQPGQTNYYYITSQL